MKYQRSSRTEALPYALDGDGRVRPGQLRITQQRGDASPVNFRFGRQTAQVNQRRIKIHQVHHAGTILPRLHPRHADGQRQAGGFGPERGFAEAQFLAQMPAVVAPDDDDGVVRILAFFQRIQHQPHAIIRMAGGGQIGLHRALEQVRVLLHPVEILAGLEFDFPFGVNDIAEVIEAELGDLDALQRKTVEILLRHIPGQMRLGNAQREEERFCPMAWPVAPPPMPPPSSPWICSLGPLARSPGKVHAFAHRHYRSPCSSTEGKARAYHQSGSVSGKSHAPGQPANRSRLAVGNHSSNAHWPASPPCCGKSSPWTRSGSRVWKNTPATCNASAPTWNRACSGCCRKPRSGSA